MTDHIGILTEGPDAGKLYSSPTDTFTVVVRNPQAGSAVIFARDMLDLPGPVVTKQTTYRLVPVVMGTGAGTSAWYQFWVPDNVPVSDEGMFIMKKLVERYTVDPLVETRDPKQEEVA